MPRYLFDKKDYLAGLIARNVIGAVQRLGKLRIHVVCSQIVYSLLRSIYCRNERLLLQDIRNGALVLPDRTDFVTI